MKFNKSFCHIFIFVLLCLNFCACSNASVSSIQEPVTESPAPKTGTRDNTPRVLVGHPDGTVTLGNALVTIDISHTEDGYLMVRYNGDCNRVKFQLTGPDQITYTYDLTKGNYETFPITASDGSYKVGVYENIQGTRYSTLFTDKIQVTITNTFGPYLYANQYVNFSNTSKAVEIGQQLAISADSDLDVIESVYNYVITNYSYDYDKASTVASGYLPDIDHIISDKKGICFDYASVMTALLRTQRIPTRLEVGYVDDIYHAWISTYIDGQGWIDGVIEFNGKDWKLLDPTFAATSSSPKDFLAKDSEYVTKYIY